jgi:predicted alpha/beta-hydrolase family hydrolase
MKFTKLDIVGYQERPVLNTFIEQDTGAGSDHLAVLLPGMRYSNAMPLMHMHARLLAELGADLLLVDYDYERNPAFAAAPDREQLQWLQEDTLAACSVGLARGLYERVTLVGKSLGTMAMPHLLSTEPELAQAQGIWLTPVLLNMTMGVITAVAQPSLFIIGTADRYYDPDKVDALRAMPASEVLVIDGADHSLEIPGNIRASVPLLGQVLAASAAFLGGD